MYYITLQSIFDVLFLRFKRKIEQPFFFFIIVLIKQKKRTITKHKKHKMF